MFFQSAEKKMFSNFGTTPDKNQIFAFFLI
jgi:hypothetical protein